FFYRITTSLPSIATRLFLMICILLCIHDSTAQTIIKGRITDAETGQGLNGVTVLLSPGGQSTASDSLGFYILRAKESGHQIEFRTLGYKTAYHTISRDPEQTVSIQME